MATVSQLAPAGVKVVAAMAMVRNSVGSNCYVADEIITSRAGVRLRVGNTDAEGRMVRRSVSSLVQLINLNIVGHGGRALPRQGEGSEESR